MKLIRFLMARMLAHPLLIGLLVCGSFLLPWALTSQTAYAATHPTAASTSMRSGNDTIVLVHGYNGAGYGSDAGFHCDDGSTSSYWHTTISYLGGTHNINGQNISWHRKDFRTLGFYRQDRYCSDYLNNYGQYCVGYFDGGNLTNNESIHHLAC
ncbi:MAG: hypothetical protein M3Z24_08630 [Chloroflexota bacterium]|nr:hypothetical protein [Chloroflexota bacterium]